MSRPVNATLTRQVLLARAEHELTLVRQWSGMGDWARAAHYEAKAEAIIELVEIDDCGSVGGYDKKRGQPDVWRLKGNDRLADRLKWLQSL